MLFFTSCDISDTDTKSANKYKAAVTMAAHTSSPNQVATARKNSSPKLSQVKLLVEDLELKSSVDQDSLDFEVNNLVVNLPLDGSALVLAEATVPEGLYNKFEMEIEKPYNNSIEDPDFYSENGNDGYSIVIKGTYNGKAFTYHSEEEFELELNLNPPLEVSAGASPSVAIDVDPFTWFKDEAGNDLDPTNPANIQQINDNIRKSFGAEKGDDDGDNGDDGDDNDDGDDDEDNDDGDNNDDGDSDDNDDGDDDEDGEDNN